MTPAFNANNIHMLNQRILSGYCSSSIPIGRYSRELMDLAKHMIDINANSRPSIIDILQMEPVKKRIEGSDINLNNFDDYTIIRGLQTTIYPPMNVSGWDRVVIKLREILGMEKEDLFNRKESNYNYNAILSYAPPQPIVQSNEQNRPRIKLPSLNNNRPLNNYKDRYSHVKPRVQLDPFNRNVQRISSPPWARHFL